MKEKGKEKSRDASVTVGELVAEDYRVAGIFEKVGIDFCCGGKVVLSEACREKGVSPDDILHQIEAVQSAPLDRGQDYSSWTLSFLADYIVNTHHAYLRENMEQIAAYARKVAGIHGANHQEVIDISKIFDKIVTDMSAHLREEEEVFFPSVKRIEAAVTDGAKPDAKDIAAIRDGLEKLVADHEEIGDAVHEIRFLSKDYEIPGDACNTYMLTYRKLREFEDDLHRHVHLENNILFPKAAAL